MKFRNVLVAGIAAMTMAVGSAQAASVFSGTMSGDFIKVKNLSGWGNSADVDGNTVTWGNKYDWHHSEMEIVTTDFSKDLEVGTNNVKIGTLSWFNASWYNFDDFFKVKAVLTLDLDSPLDHTTNDKIWLEIGTTNNANNPNADGAMIAKFDDFGLDLPFELDTGITLTSFFAELSADSAHKGSFSDNFWVTKEKKKTYLDIFAVIDVQPVPLPAAGWMLIAGVGGLGAMKRRAKKKAA